MHPGSRLKSTPSGPTPLWSSTSRINHSGTWNAATIHFGSSSSSARHLGQHLRRSFFFLIELIGVKLVHKIIQVSSVQLNKASRAHQTAGISTCPCHLPHWFHQAYLPPSASGHPPNTDHFQHISPSHLLVSEDERFVHVFINQAAQFHSYHPPRFSWAVLCQPASSSLHLHLFPQSNSLFAASRSIHIPPFPKKGTAHTFCNPVPLPPFPSLCNPIS